jgi:hypothetical protein
MAVGIPARAEESRRYDIHYDNLSQAVANALAASGWKYYVHTPYQFGAETKLNFWSWGETMSFLIYQDGTVSAQSKCSFPVQLFDWGKNKRNLGRFFQLLDWSLSQPPPHIPAQQ